MQGVSGWVGVSEQRSCKLKCTFSKMLSSSHYAAERQPVGRFVMCLSAYHD